jgi:hypothetical protein
VEHTFTVRVKKTTLLAAVASLCGGLGPPFARGFGGKLTIHPAQIEPIKRRFLPSLNRFRFEELCSKIGGEMVEHVVFSQEPG